MSMGAYYADTPGFDLPVEAIGSINLSSSAVWADIQTFEAFRKMKEQSAPGSAVEGEGAANAASRRAANRIRAALAQLGFGPDVKMDTYWGTGADCPAYELFLSTMGLGRVPGPCGGVSKQQLDVLEQLVVEQNQTGKTPGPLKVVEYHETSPGTMVPGPAPGQKSLKLSGSLQWTSLLLILGIVGAAGAAYLILRKRKTVYTRTTTTFKNNRRRRRRRVRR